MASGKKGKQHRSESEKAYYASYPGKAQTHRSRRQNRHSRLHPNDSVGNSTVYRRQKPGSENGWATKKQDQNLSLGPASYPLSEQQTKAKAKQYAQDASFAKGVHKKMQYERNQKRQQPEQKLGYAEEMKQNG